MSELTMSANTSNDVCNANDFYNMKSNVAASECSSNAIYHKLNIPASVYSATNYRIEFAKKMPEGANTIIDKEHNDGIYVIFPDVYGYRTSVVLPHIKDVQTINNKVVIVVFADGTKEKAVLDSADTFSLEQGISICITKKLLSMKTGGNGSSTYNKLIGHCLKIFENNRNAEVEEKAAIERKKKAVEKARAKRIKKANKNREREIEIQKEAYLRAMREFGGNPAVND